MKGSCHCGAIKYEVPNYHIYTDSQVKWLTIDDTCKKYPQGRFD